MFQISESTNIVHFNVDGAKKTSVKVVGTFEDPWFCGRDVCEILEYSNIKQAIQINVQQKSKKTLKELSEKWGLHGKPHFILGSENLSIKFPQCQTVYIYINEPDLYALILKSFASLTNQFQNFICGVVFLQ
jgi:prophage antirepressor-like protein